jgi:hypothetical protein
MYEQDWFMRQVQMMVQLVARIVWKKDTVAYEIGDSANLTQTDYLYKDLRALIDKREICAAENLLFENIDEQNQDFLLLATDFYQRLNELDDDELEAANFSRDEIKTGLSDIMAKFGIPQFEI